MSGKSAAAQHLEDALKQLKAAQDKEKHISAAKHLEQSVATGLSMINQKNSKAKASSKTLQPFIEGLVAYLADFYDQPQPAVLSVLRCIISVANYNKGFAKIVFQCDGVSALINVSRLFAENPSVLLECVSALQAITCDEKKGPLTVRLHGGVGSLAEILRDFPTHTRLIRHSLELLVFLVEENRYNQVLLAKKEFAVRQLMTFATRFDKMKIVLASCQILAKLCNHDQASAYLAPLNITSWCLDELDLMSKHDMKGFNSVLRCLLGCVRYGVDMDLLLDHDALEVVTDYIDICDDKPVTRKLIRSILWGIQVRQYENIASLLPAEHPYEFKSCCQKMSLSSGTNTGTPKSSTGGSKSRANKKKTPRSGRGTGRSRHPRSQPATPTEANRKLNGHRSSPYRDLEPGSPMTADSDMIQLPSMSLESPTSTNRELADVEPVSMSEVKDMPQPKPKKKKRPDFEILEFCPELWPESAEIAALTAHEQDVIDQAASAKHARRFVKLPKPPVMSSREGFPTASEVPVKNEPLYVAPRNIALNHLAEAGKILHDPEKLIKAKVCYDRVVASHERRKAFPEFASEPGEAPLIRSSSDLVYPASPRSANGIPGDAQLLNIQKLPQLRFESRFECGNLHRAIQISDVEYDLILSADINTLGRTQWFYFAVENMVPGVRYKFNIINLEKTGSAFQDGMRPVMYSVARQRDTNIGWTRATTSDNITYYPNYFERYSSEVAKKKLAKKRALKRPGSRGKDYTLLGTLDLSKNLDSDDSDLSDAKETADDLHQKAEELQEAKQEKMEKAKRKTSSVSDIPDDENRPKPISEDDYMWTLTFSLKFPHANDTVYLAYCFPFSFNFLHRTLTHLQANSPNATNMRRQVLCMSRGGNIVELLTITDFTAPIDVIKQRQVVVISSRVHPGEVNASWIMKGFLDFIMSNAEEARLLRRRLVFKIVPMLNPDGVTDGHNRCSLGGIDLNRQYKHPDHVKHPPVYHIKQLTRRLAKTRSLLLYCDIHGHSRMKDHCLYGCDPHDPRCHVQQASPEDVMDVFPIVEPDLPESLPGKERILPYLLHRRAPRLFQYNICKFNVSKDKAGCGRVVFWKELRLWNCFTMESSFCGSSVGEHSDSHFSTGDYEDMGKYFAIAINDMVTPDNYYVREAISIITTHVNIEKPSGTERRKSNMKRRKSKPRSKRSSSTFAKKKNSQTMTLKYNRRKSLKSKSRARDGTL